MNLGIALSSLYRYVGLYKEDGLDGLLDDFHFFLTIKSPQFFANSLENINFALNRDIDSYGISN